MTRRLRRWILAAIVAAPVLGCGLHQTSPTEPAVQPDSVTIDSIFPRAGTTLAPGSTVVFGAVLRYQASQPGGGGIAAQTEDQNGALLPSTATAVPQGAGTLTLTSPFQVPSSGASHFNVDYVLYATFGETTEIAAITKVSYPVGR